MKQYKNWMIKFLITTLCFTIVLCSIAYCIDPCFHYSYKNRRYFLKSRFVNSGIIRHYDYDAAVVGSSMTQNFNMDSFRQKLKVNPIKVTTGGIGYKEIEILSTLTTKVNKAKKYYIGCDVYLFGNSEFNFYERFPKHLVDDNPLNDYKYLLGYETWFRFIPFDLALLVYDGLSKPNDNKNVSPLEKRIADSTSVDMLEDWSNDYVFSRESVIDLYLQNKKTSSVDIVDEKIISDRIDRFFCFGNNDPDVEYVLFFPPYSALYWADLAEDKEVLNYIISVKKSIVEKCENYDNITIYDFQAEEFIMDLDNYKDLTHYKPEINEWMIDCFVSKKNVINIDGFENYNDKLLKRIDEFREENPELFSD